jgi:DNA (cytosine-5)-methyltransferase 3A
MSLRLLFGGSPCTTFSIAATATGHGRESAPFEGKGWELFEAFAKAKDRWGPGFFLYENVASMSNSVRDAMSERLGTEPVMIDSALVSAQTRKRYYWTNAKVPQPADVGRTFFEEFRAYPAALRGRRDKNGKLAQHIETFSKLKGKMGALLTWGKNNYKLVRCYGTGDCTVKGKTLAYRGQESSAPLVPDGNYKVCSLTVSEASRLQTLPSHLRFPVTDREAKKIIALGWTTATIVHIIRQWGLDSRTPYDVLSMFDGMAGAYVALRELGINNIRRYQATEISKSAIAVALANFPSIEECGDALAFVETI